SSMQKELIYTGDLIDSAEALRLGLVNRVVPLQDLPRVVEELVDKISSKSPLILRLAKDALNSSVAGLKEGLDYESALFAYCFATDDQKEGARAFLEKRKPAFKGN
ncbi:MAG: enoyl-CoA hydratase-related protein, partial [Thaumarchaeota archaeon]|nr:enoyl-CoA hydratase-related protein [Nitrososphaerota archaeon]